MKYETSVVYLEQLPKISVDTGFDWASLWTFLATVVIFMLGTYMTIRNFNKTVRSQEKVADINSKTQRDLLLSQESIARQSSLKASRQNWINDLRNTTADYIASALNLQRLNLYREAVGDSWGANDPHLTAWSHQHIQSVKELVSLKSKIELLLNPDELDSKQMMKSVNELREKCDQAGGPAKELSESVVKCCQHIVKQEWEKAKSGK